jgi:hypothetical protein
MKKLFYLTSFLSLCCFYVGKTNTLFLKKVNNVTNPYEDLLNKIVYNSIIGQNILEGEKYSIEHESKNLEEILSNSQGKYLLTCDLGLIKSDKNSDDFSNNTLTITEAFYFLDRNDTLGCISGNCKNGTGEFIWPNGDKFEGLFNKRKPFSGRFHKKLWEGIYFASFVRGFEIDTNGYIHFPNRNTFKGVLKEGKINRGKLYTYSSNEHNLNESTYETLYEGDFKSLIVDGQFKLVMDGQGTLTSKIGDKYVGEFKDGKMNGKGTFTYSNRNKYFGEFKDGKMNGQGTYTFSSGAKYVGEFKEGEKNGQGTFTESNGNIYVGQFKDDQPNGQGTLTYKNGNIYVGQFKDDQPNGQGTFTKIDGEKYIGEFKYGRYNGKGTLRNKDQKYDGEFKDGKYHGQGTLYNRDRYEYEYVGEFKDGKYNGQGTLNFHNGKNYIGEFKDGIYNGKGTFNGVHGEKYVGEFKNGRFDGQGTSLEQFGDIYVGEFKNGIYDGQGTLTKSNGEIKTYVGEFKNDEYEGKGRLTYKNGTIYEGEFKDGKFNGQGILISSVGKKTVGEWKDGNYINQEKLNNDALIKNPNIGTNSTLNNSSISSFGNGLVKCNKCGKSFPKRQGFCKFGDGGDPNLSIDNNGLSSPCAMSYADILIGLLAFKDNLEVLNYYKMLLDTSIWVCSKNCSYKIGLCID